MAKVEYDTHGIPSIRLSSIDKEELEMTGTVQLDQNLWLLKTDEDVPRVVVLKQIPYNCIKFEEKAFLLKED